jgi:periplasmic divalent cation tolerance protein
MLPELIQIITTTAEKSDAVAIASMLVERRFAACTQISGPIESYYWWNDRIEVAREWHVLAKTKASLYANAEAAILEMHPYDEPEVLSIPIVSVSDGYRQWLLDQLALPAKPSKPQDIIESKAAVSSSAKSPK